MVWTKYASAGWVHVTLFDASAWRTFTKANPGLLAHSDAVVGILYKSKCGTLSEASVKAGTISLAHAGIKMCRPAPRLTCSDKVIVFGFEVGTLPRSHIELRLVFSHELKRAVAQNASHFFFSNGDFAKLRNPSDGAA